MIQSTDEVIDQLDQIVRSSIDSASHCGYFAALYKRVTIEIRDCIQRGEFEDNPRMEKLDIIFASRYLDAHRAFSSGHRTTASWRTAFEADSPRLITLQHLLIGMNAHISLDLGIAAAEVSNGNPLSLKNDFYTINRILESLIDEIQKRLTHIFGAFGIVDRLLGPIDERLSIFSIAYARDRAWAQTLEHCFATPEQRVEQIRARDLAVSKFSKQIAIPPRLSIRLLLLAIRILERGTVPTRIKLLDTQG